MAEAARVADRVKVAVLISGAGSNMAALIEAGHAIEAPFEVVLVLSNNPEAHGLMLAQAAVVRAVAIDHRPFGKDRVAHEQALDAALQEAGVQVVVLAGYMRIVTPWLVERWRDRMLNIHPSLLPLYAGLDTHARAIAAGDAEAGCTVHLVTAGVDEGPILAQARVPILSDDDSASLSERVRTAEHRLYPQAVADYCRNVVRRLQD